MIEYELWLWTGAQYEYVGTYQTRHEAEAVAQDRRHRIIEVGTLPTLIR